MNQPDFLFLIAAIGFILMEFGARHHESKWIRALEPVARAALYLCLGVFLWSGWATA